MPVENIIGIFLKFIILFNKKILVISDDGILIKSTLNFFKISKLFSSKTEAENFIPIF